MTDRMRILLVNGNSSEAQTRRMADLAQALFGALINVEAMTISSAPPYVLTRADCTLAAGEILSVVGKRLRDRSLPPIDGVFIACFGEPGLKAVREISSVPVVGMLESSVLSALQMGERFSILTPGADWPAMLMELLRAWSLDGRCSGISEVSSDALVDDGALRADALDREARTHLQAYPSEVLIIGGGALAGRSADIRPVKGVKVLDCFTVTLGQLIGLIQTDRVSRACPEQTHQV